MADAPESTSSAQQPVSADEPTTARQAGAETRAEVSGQAGAEVSGQAGAEVSGGAGAEVSGQAGAEVSGQTQAQSGAPDPELHEEPHDANVGSRLNWLRAGVLGANDGIVSTAGIVIGVAGATSSVTAIATAGVAGLVAGSLSMAGGEYVSVSTQRDTEKALLVKERWELENMPDEELEELTRLYQAKGISRHVAEEVARDLTKNDALRAHAEAELGLDPDELTNPWHAAGSSFISFAVGALIPLVVILLPINGARVWATVGAVVLGLVLTGFLSARLGKAPEGRAIVRNVGMGILTMAITFAVGKIFGTTVG